MLPITVSIISIHELISNFDRESCRSEQHICLMFEPWYAQVGNSDWTLFFFLQIITVTTYYIMAFYYVKEY
jgi:hypothetical protein